MYSQAGGVNGCAVLFCFRKDGGRPMIIGMKTQKDVDFWLMQTTQQVERLRRNLSHNTGGPDEAFLIGEEILCECFNKLSQLNFKVEEGEV